MTEAGVYLKWLLSRQSSAPIINPVSLALAINRPNVIFRLTFIELCLRVVLISLDYHSFH